MKKIIVPLFLTLLFIAPLPVLAHNDQGQAVSLETEVQNLLLKQQVDTVQELDCGKITDEDFEALGDSWMEETHPGSSHEVMDNMMGGEGSQSLESAHIQMGRNYLGCNDQQYGYGYMGMMGGYRSAPTQAGQYGQQYTSSHTEFLYDAVGVALIAFLLSGTFFFVKKMTKK